MAEGGKESAAPQIRDYLQAGFPCLFLRTVEPHVAEHRVRVAMEELQMTDTQFGVWRVTTGLLVGRAGHVDSVSERGRDLVDALKYVENEPNPTVAIFHNVRQFVNHYQVVQHIVDAVFAVKSRGSHLIFVGPHLELPPELKNLVQFVDCPLPNRDQIETEFGKVARKYGDALAMPKRKSDVEDLVRAAANAAVGLDMMGAENAIALSLAVADGIDINVIQKQKEQEVKKSDVLEFFSTIETMDNVGGFAALKEWIRKRRRVFTEEARAYGLPYPKGMLIVGPAGCLSGDTVLHFRSGKRNSGRAVTVLEAFYKFNQIPRAGVGGRVKHRSGSQFLWDTETPTQTLSLMSGVVGYHEIEEIVFSGIKETFLIETATGRSLRVTAEHPFKVPVGTPGADDEGFKPLKDLQVGDEVLVRPRAWDHWMSVSKEEHDRLHGNQQSRKNLRFSGVVSEKVTRIELFGEEETFDLVMRAPYHNYLAHGFVVHNTGKSLVAKATAQYYQLPLLRLDMGKVFRSLVGESEAAIRMALQVCEAVSPVVLWMDEIEKAMAGAAGSGELDSGVTARVVSTVLTWRQETTYPVVLVATANNVATLPSMVYRKGRLDEVWATDLPREDEREEIFGIHLHKRGRNPRKFNLPFLAKITSEFVGAEVEGVIEDAMFAAFDEGVEVADKHIAKAIKEMIPQAQRDVEELKAIREWARTRARSVSGEDHKVGEAHDKVRQIRKKKGGK